MQNERKQITNVFFKKNYHHALQTDNNKLVKNQLDRIFLTNLLKTSLKPVLTGKFAERDF